MSDLRTDFKDDVLNITTNEKRKYRMINNADGTVSFEDVTDYVQQGDTFGATEVNQITEKVNSCLTRQDVVDNLESTSTDLPLSANRGRELKEMLPPIPTEGRTRIADNISNGYEWIATDNGWVNITATSTGSGYVVLRIYNGDVMVNAGSVSQNTSSQYADMISLPIKKGQKASIECVNYASISLVMCK